jgi:hypothetical protein
VAQLVRVKVANPAPKRAKVRRKGSDMAVKKRKRARKKAGNPKRKRAKAPHRRRARAANPKRSRARKRAHNPRRKAGKRRHAAHGTRAKTHHRSSMRNPHARKRGKRRHKRNPEIPVWAMAGLAGAAGLASFALSTSAAFGLTKRLDPGMTSLSRNRMVAGGAFTAAGLLLAAFAHPLVGAAVAAGGLAALAGTQLSFAIDPIWQLGIPADTTTAKKITGIFDGQRQRLGGVYTGAGRQNFGRSRGGLVGIGGIYQAGSQAFHGGVTGG